MASISNKKIAPKATTDEAVKPAPAPVTKAPAKVAPTKAVEAETPVDAEEATEAPATTAKAEKAPKVLAKHPILGISVASEKADRWIAVDTLRKMWKSNEHFWANIESFALAALSLAVERGGKEHDKEFWIKKLTANAAWQAKIGQPLPGYEPRRAEMTEERKAKLKEQLKKGRATAAKNRAVSADADEAEVAEEG